MSLRGKVVLITGASSGIGAALARELAQRGAHLVLTARRLERLEELATELRLHGAQVLCVAADVTRDGDLEHAVARACTQFGGVDVAVANAGFGLAGAMAKLTLSDVRRQLETNLFGVLRTFYAARASLIERHGVLVMIGSVSGFVSVPGTVAYSVSKFGVRALAEGLRAELHRDGVAVVHIAPGFIRSEIRQVDNQGQLHPEARDPVPRWLQMPAEEAARQIADAIERRRARHVVTRHGKLAVALSQHAHGLVDAVLRLSQARWRNKRTKP
jgi:short-subunit dehydrogenase